jgi:serine/threonine protein phosphatase PrpC
LRYETAELSLIGDRDQNQDRVLVAENETGCILAVLDGMGGHAEGERAAEVAVESIREEFAESPDSIKDPTGFLNGVVQAAHEAVVAIGSGLSVEHKPRATCAVCLVHQGRAWWAHVGDARIYLLRNGSVVERTRDHSHVEVLLQEGLILPEEVTGHPMRHYVEACLGGESALPDLTLPNFRGLQTGDVLLVCSDGLWSGLSEDYIGTSVEASMPVAEWLGQLAEKAVAANGPHSDNTTAAALRVCAN